MSARENIAINLVKQLENMTDPAVGSVSRVFFDVQKLAITQFPAILVTTSNETREDISTDLRQGTIRYNLRCYVRGTQVDTLRNELVERLLEYKKYKDAASMLQESSQRWQQRYKSAVEAFKQAKDMFERAKKYNDAVLIANTENSLKDCQKEKDALEIFKKDLGTFVRFYEFMSQIVDYDNPELEKLSLFARNLRPMLRETILDEDVTADRQVERRSGRRRSPSLAPPLCPPVGPGHDGTGTTASCCGVKR